MHLTHEELATVSRLRRLKAGEPWMEVYTDLSHSQSQADRFDAVDILLRLLLEDDDSEMPVTEEWLRSVGFKHGDHPAKWTIHREDAMPIGLWKVDDGWKAMLIHHENAASCLVRQQNTRRDVRRLASALVITLTEQRT